MWSSGAPWWRQADRVSGLEVIGSVASSATSGGIAEVWEKWGMGRRAGGCSWMRLRGSMSFNVAGENRGLRGNGFGCDRTVRVRCGGLQTPLLYPPILRPDLGFLDACLCPTQHESQTAQRRNRCPWWRGPNTSTQKTQWYVLLVALWTNRPLALLSKPTH